MSLGSHWREARVLYSRYLTRGGRCARAHMCVSVYSVYVSVSVRVCVRARIVCLVCMVCACSVCLNSVCVYARSYSVCGLHSVCLQCVFA